MSKLDTYKKQAKLLIRWHREGNYSIGGRIRGLARYRTLADAETLALKFPLSEAQEIIALEEGFESWAKLKTALESGPEKTRMASAAASIQYTIPVLFVSDVQRSAAFYGGKLGFKIDFLHGHPAFYGSVSRDGARLHIRFVHEPVLVAGIREKERLLAAFIAVENIKGLFAEYVAAGVDFEHKLRKEPWGTSGFTVRDPDGNWIYFGEG